MDDYGQEEFNKERGKHEGCDCGYSRGAICCPLYNALLMGFKTKVYQRFASPSKHTITGSMYSASQENES